MTEPIRLSKRVIALLQCSQSEADQYIEGGWVLVDGKVVEKPQTLVGEEKVELSGAKLGPVEPATILFHRAAGADDDATAITPETHWADDPSGVRLLQRHFSRLSPVLPLEKSASGLTIFTQDDRLLRKMRDEGARMEREHIVSVTGKIVEGGLARLGHGLVFDGRMAPPMKVSWQNEDRLRFATKAIDPGLLEKMCAAVGLTWVSTKRLRVGRVPLSKMPVGSWRYLPAGERI